MRAVPINMNYRYVADGARRRARDADAVGLVMDGSRPASANELAGSGRWVLTTGVGGDYEDALAAGVADARDFGPRSGDDHYVLYTGGTTGRPKGVVWRQEDIFFTAIGGGNPGGDPLTDPETIAPSVRRQPEPAHRRRSSRRTTRGRGSSSRSRSGR